MKKIPYYFITLIPFVFLALVWRGQPSPTIAQGLEEQQQEQTLEQQLNINF